MKKRILIIFLTFFLGLTSCKKDKTTPTTSSSKSTEIENTLKIKSAMFISSTEVPFFKMDTITMMTYIDTFVIENEFNSSGKIVSGVFSSAKTNTIKIDVRYVVSYAEVNKVIVKDSDLKTQTVYSLNALGNAWLVESLGNASKTDTFLYDKNGFLSQERSFSVDKKRLETKVMNDNLIELGTTKFEYYTDKINQIGQFNLSHFFDQTNIIPLPIFGKSSKNLVKSITDNEGGVINFSYEYDSKGRIIKRSCIYSDGPGGEHDFKTTLILTYED
jgi:hypothetical protein